MSNEEFTSDAFPRAAAGQGGDALEGRVFGDNYAIEALIGVGGMGRVYRATQRALSRTVAVKVIHPHLLEDDDTVARFYTEARAASSLNHPNSVSIFDFGRTDDGMLYLVMEFLRGRDLSALMAEGPLEVERCVDLAAGVLAALGEAHARGVVHCDLKPENIIIERLRSGGDLVKVVDFGLAKILGAEPTSDQKKGLVSGTPDYMSPEQARAIEVDGRGDIYALGVVLFEMLAGRLPFLGKNATEVMTAHVMDKPPHPAAIAPERNIPEAISRVVLQALSKLPGDRFADAEDMARALRDALPRRPRGDQIVCGECGMESVAGSKFCGECGARLQAQALEPSLEEVTAPLRRVGASIQGREDEMAKLEALRVDGNQPRLAHVAGPPGIGRTSLLEALASIARQSGDAVVMVGPHASGTPVAYAHLTSAIAGLVGAREDELGALADSGDVFADVVARAGMTELRLHQGLPGLPGKPAAEAVAVTLARAVEMACAGASSGRTLLLFDDVDRGDGLTPRVLSAFLDREDALDVMVVATTEALPTLAEVPTLLEISLNGLAREHVDAFVPSGVALPELPGGGFLPLLGEQLRALGWAPTLDDPEVPTLADAVARRLDELDASARRLLQAVAVLGSSASMEAVRGLVAPEELACVDVLSQAGLARCEDDVLIIAHPFVRDLVHLSIPAETRRSLHSRALDLLADLEAPLEVRTEHACRAGEPMAALMLLERMGGDALDRGDADVSVFAFRSGVELARRELLETGDTGLDRALVSFSRRLGEALLAAGDAPQAAGVVREAIELANDDARGRAQMLCLLAEAALQRGRGDDARRLLGEAGDVSERVQGPHLRVRIATVQARVCELEDDARGASEALRDAWEAAHEAGDPGQAHAPLGVALANSLLELGEHGAARGPLEEVCVLAESRDHGALWALALGTLGRVDEIAGNLPAARAHYAEAAARADIAGDVGAAESWRAAVAALPAADAP